MSRLVTYTFDLPDGKSLSFSVDVNRKVAAGTPPPFESPDWTRLEYHRCPHCPLAGTCSHCPPAVDAAPILEKFSHVNSVAKVRVTVATPERTSVKETDAQTGLNALLGLVMATSACPIVSRLRSQALFHLPFASVEETLYRTVGDYLIKQYFIMKDGGTPDFGLTGLDALYRDLAELNGAFFKRVQAASPRDANVNAVVFFRSLSDIVSMSLEDRLAPLREAMDQAGS